MAYSGTRAPTPLTRSSVAGSQSPSGTRGGSGIARGDLGWTITSYSLIFGSLLLFGGLAADLLGRRRVFVSGLAICTGASLLAALAGDATTVFEARAGQGLGAALLSPAALSILTSSFHGPERAKALGAWARSAAPARRSACCSAAR